MNTSTYAKLTKPPQFRADESATFRLEYSRDMSCNYATLRIYGYMLDGYEGTTITKYINTSILGVGYEEFVVPPNTLGTVPSIDTPMIPVAGNMKAVVEIGDELDEEGNAIPIFKSNEVIVDMPVNFPTDYYIAPQKGTLMSNASTYKVELNYISRKLFGTFGSTEVNSYQVLLYDNNYNLIKSSGDKYDWNSALYRNHFYTISGLADNTTYYIKAKLTLVGGYTINLDFRKLEVKYTEIPSYSEQLYLENDKIHGRVTINITPDVQYNKIVVSRAVKDTNNYLELKTISRDNATTEQAIIYDYYALPNVTYLYRVVLFDGDNITATYYSEITHEFEGICIADAYGGYNALAFDKKYPINKNDRTNVVEPMDTQYPTTITNNRLDYDSGSITATFARINNKCEPDFINNAEYSMSIRHWLNNGRTKLLKYYNGECWLVAVSGVTDDDPNGNDVITTSFNWTQVGDVNDNEEYLRLGLILNE